MAGSAIERRQLLHVSTSHTTPTPVPISGRRRLFRIFRPLVVEKPSRNQEDAATSLERSQSSNAPGSELREPITAEIAVSVPSRRGSMAFRLYSSLVERYDALKERLGIHTSPMARLEIMFLRQKTTDWAQAMEKSLGAVLSREGYCPEFRDQVLALTSDDPAVRGLEHAYAFCEERVTPPETKVERLFVAAFALLQDADSEYGQVRLNNAQVLGAIRLMSDLLPKLHSEQLIPYVKHASDAISKGTDEKKLEAARLFVRMCNAIDIASFEAVRGPYHEVSALTSPEYGPGTNEAARLFIERMEHRIIDVGRNLQSVA